VSPTLDDGHFKHAAADIFGHSVANMPTFELLSNGTLIPGGVTRHCTRGATAEKPSEESTPAARTADKGGGTSGPARAMQILGRRRIYGMPNLADASPVHSRRTHRQTCRARMFPRAAFFRVRSCAALSSTEKLDEVGLSARRVGLSLRRLGRPEGGLSLGAAPIEVAGDFGTAQAAAELDNASTTRRPMGKRGRRSYNGAPSFAGDKRLYGVLFRTSRPAFRLCSCPLIGICLTGEIADVRIRAQTCFDCYEPAVALGLFGREFGQRFIHHQILLRLDRRAKPISTLLIEAQRRIGWRSALQHQPQIVPPT
jgi:hypothetical protein